MGSGASTPDQIQAQQQELDDAVLKLVSMTWDRVEIRCHHGQIAEGVVIDPQIFFEIVPGSEEDSKYPVAHELVDEQNHPGKCDFMAPRSAKPIWNDSQLLLYRRAGEEATAGAIPSRKLRVRLEDFRTIRDKIEDGMEDAADKIGKFSAAAYRKVNSMIRESRENDSLEEQNKTEDNSKEACDASGPKVEVAEDMEGVPTADSEAGKKEGGETEDAPAIAQPESGRNAEAAKSSSEMPQVAKMNPDILFDLIVDLPAPSEGWVHKTLSTDRGSVHFSFKSSLWEDKISSRAVLDQVEGVMQKFPLGPLSDGNMALLRLLPSDVSSDPTKKGAFLWIPGFNDSFHNHLAAKVIHQAGYDLWLIDLRRCGACRREFPGKTSPLLYHHSEDFDEYNQEIGMAVEKIQGSNYKNIVGYGHGTGCTILLNYIHKSATKDSPFSGFVLNSPFLDWGQHGGAVKETMVDGLITGAVKLGLVDPEKAMSKGGSTTDLNSYQFRMYSFFEFDTQIKALYKLHITAGWEAASSKVRNMISRNSQLTPFTLKPFLVLTSKQDSTVSDQDLTRLSLKIGPQHTIIKFQWAHYDVFNSYDTEKVNEGLHYLIGWLNANPL